MMKSREATRIIGDSVPVINLVRMIQKVAPSRANVLVVGESGTGKELVARSIHDLSPAKGKPFIAINCGAIPENLIESELFGHKKGSFTGAIADKPGLFEAADGGTLFLDEVGELPLSMQVKLLRAIQERIIRRVGGNEDIHIDTRIISATNRDLEASVKKGGFREDLFYRLNVIMIKTPPLRDRGSDIEILANWFLEQNKLKMQRDIKGFAPQTMQQLRAYHWPGNIRELENVIERAVTLESTDHILIDSLPLMIQNASPFVGTTLNDALTTGPRSLGEPGKMGFKTGPDLELPALESDKLPCSLDEILERIERHYIEGALRRTEGKKKQAAAFLGITFRSFRYRLQKLGMGDDSDAE